ncbi:hypothetical protein [Microvirga sp. BSC39]|uniref:hypothetical protein n=1 Tax=Microvirga sp. BSC39 TaxID=1549810 RepID=UPI0004E94774|nr:hypothetical protein [Microvirga sp. BSC39]KFG66976.1 hypothetical protein JH26_27010 [Microvirga sp. BSC39]
MSIILVPVIAGSLIGLVGTARHSPHGIVEKSQNVGQEPERVSAPLLRQFRRKLQKKMQRR